MHVDPRSVCLLFPAPWLTRDPPLAAAITRELSDGHLRIEIPVLGLVLRVDVNAAQPEMSVREHGAELWRGPCDIRSNGTDVLLCRPDDGLSAWNQPWIILRGNENGIRIPCAPTNAHAT